MIILGLVIFVAAVVIGVAGVLSNSGSAHDFTGGFSVFGVDVTGSTGTLFLYGIVVGAAALLGLAMILTGTRTPLVAAAPHVAGTDSLSARLPRPNRNGTF